MAPISQAEPFLLDTMATPIGEMLIVTDAAGQLRALDWSDHEDRMWELLRRHYEAPRLQPGRPPEAIVSRLEEYFAGNQSSIETIPVATNGTAFQRAVWRALREIPPGRTMSYAGLAAAIGRPAGARAVGLANGANPIGIVVPCHRVIGTDGSLTGYGGGIFRKAWLLEHEGVSLASRPQPALAL